MVANGATATAAMRGMGTPGGAALFPAKGPYACTVKDPTAGAAFPPNTNFGAGNFGQITRPKVCASES